MAKRSASGSGSIRKKTVEINGKTYTNWEARYTAGFDPGTGKQIQRTITGKTQKEVSRKLKEILVSLDNNSYTAPQKMTVSQWLDTWYTTYCRSQKPTTLEKYEADIRLHIKPHIGALQLQQLDTTAIQQFYNELDLSPKTIRNIHGVLSKSLNQALKLGYIPRNPCTFCDLPTSDPHEFHVLNSQQLVAYVRAAGNDDLGNLFITMLFTGMRRGEIMGLTWDCVNFPDGSITVKQQLSRTKDGWDFAPTKSSNVRRLIPPPMVMDALRRERNHQRDLEDDYPDIYHNPHNFVFTSPTGHFMGPNTIMRHNGYILEAAGLPHIRVHDLRHTFAVTSLQAGDDTKTLQENLGHADASFTLNVYAHVLDEMKRQSSSRLQSFFDAAEKPKSNSNKGKNKGKTKIG